MSFQSPSPLDHNCFKGLVPGIIGPFQQDFIPQGSHPMTLLSVPTMSPQIKDRNTHLTKGSHRVSCTFRKVAGTSGRCHPGTKGVQFLSLNDPSKCVYEPPDKRKDYSSDKGPLGFLVPSGEQLGLPEDAILEPRASGSPHPITLLSMSTMCPHITGRYTL